MREMISASNKTRRGHALGKALGITMLMLLLAGNAGAAPYAYITNLYDNSVSVIDTATDTVTATVNVGIMPFGVAVNPTGTRVYVANSHVFGSVSVIDTATNNVTAEVNVGRNPVAFGQFIGTASTPIATTTQTPVPTAPGFGAVFAIVGMLVVAYMLKRKD